jgi:hypothetical protein
MKSNGENDNDSNVKNNINIMANRKQAMKMKTSVKEKY